MSYSESDTSSNGLTFPNVTTMSAKGPNTNITNMRFRNQLTSTMCMPRNFAFGQKSSYYRREPSPMSIHSACDIRPRSFQQYYPGTSSRQSVFNGRSGSPMSIRSIDSSASVSAADIAFAFSNVKYNKHDLKVIKDAYHKLMKQRFRKRVEKRRNMRLFLKGSRRRSGYDSGEQGSNSSLSSDDGRSVRSSYKENMSSVKSARVVMTNFHKTDNFRQNASQNDYSIDSHNVNKTLNFNNTLISKQGYPMPTQKDRFKNGFLLPSQRFNRSVASLSIPETLENTHINIKKSVINNVANHSNQNKHKICTSGSDEEIFSEVRETSTSNMQQKRTLDNNDEANLPNKKKCKRFSPIKNPHTITGLSKPKNMNAPDNNTEIPMTFEFVKPSLPVRKLKPKVQEKLITKSAQPLTDFLEPVPNKVQNNLQSVQPSNLQEKSCELDDSETTQNSEVSMRPSFIKRKLFTQKLDVAEKANLSTDTTNSPQNSAYLLQKEKNKARKLVTNQSCLNREVQDDNNLLELIHKIVPPDRMNISNQTVVNQTKSDTNNINKQNNKGNWDVSSVISMCNEEDASDTYTDEEIFNNTKKDTKDKDLETAANNIQINQNCKVVVEKLHEDKTIQKLAATKNCNLTYNNVSSNLKSSTKSFWDTDSETDAEWSATVPKRNIFDNVKKANAMLEARKENFKNAAGHASNLCNVSKYSRYNLDVTKQSNNITVNKNNNSIMNNTVDSMRKFNPSTLSIRSHRTSIKKKCCNETCASVIKTNVINQNSSLIENKKQKSIEHNVKVTEIKNLKSQDKTLIETSKPKKSTQNEKVPSPVKSSSHCKKSPKDQKSKVDKLDSSKKCINKKSESKSKPAKLNTTINAPKSKSQNGNYSSEKIKAENQNANKQVKTAPKTDDRKNMKEALNKSPKNKHKSNIYCESSTRIRPTHNNSVLQSSMTIPNDPIDPLQVSKSGRPLRSCRTSSQNRSGELSRSSQLNNTSDSTRSLRSRVIDLSSSIENITIKIKCRNKTNNNKNITAIQNRKSDVSFSLGTGKRTPTPKRFLACKRADFFKGKRKS